MIDEIQQQQRANKIFQIIKDFERIFPEDFVKCNIHKCGHCYSGYITKDNMISSSLCNRCGGMGYIGFEKIGEEFVCRNCNGYGCDRCNRLGIVDWVQHANGRDLKPQKKPHDYRPPEST